MGKEFLSKATVINASHVNKNEAWIEIKEVLLKHFLPENYSKLRVVKEQIERLRVVTLDAEKGFEKIFMSIQTTSSNLKESEIKVLRRAIDELTTSQEEYQSYNNAFHSIINEHPLLASYSNILVIVSLMSYVIALLFIETT
jgi:hypothetical protein